MALNLTGVNRDQVRRGDWVLHPDSHAPTRVLDLEMRWLGGAPAARGDFPVHVHTAATHITGRATMLGGSWVRPALDHAVGALAHDRVILRDAGATTTLGAASCSTHSSRAGAPGRRSGLPHSRSWRRRLSRHCVGCWGRAG